MNPQLATYSPTATRKEAGGFSLVEVVLAIGIVSFAILAIVALLPIGLKSEQTSIDEIAAGNLLRSIYADFSNSPITSGSSVRFKQPLPATITSSQTMRFYVNENEGVVSSGSAKFQVILDYIPPPTNTPTMPPMVHMQVTWPAAATAANAQGSVETSLTFPKP